MNFKIVISDLRPLEIHLRLLNLELMSAEHRRQQLQWCRERQHWNLKVVFYDEFRFSLGAHQGRIRVRRRRVKRSEPHLDVESHVDRIAGVMV